MGNPLCFYIRIREIRDERSGRESTARQRPDALQLTPKVKPSASTGAGEKASLHLINAFQESWAN
jgi:hypothetical protein